MIIYSGDTTLLLKKMGWYFCPYSTTPYVTGSVTYLVEYFF